MHRAVFIDRDGVVNSDEGHYYVYRKEDFVLNEGLIEGLKMLKQAGYKLVLISNQGGVDKGEYTIDDVALVHDYMQKLLMNEELAFDAIYYCPHHDSISDCSCRKPKPGMILQALKDQGIDPKQSFLIGDSARDIEAGEAAGLKKCFLIKKNSSIVSSCEQIVLNNAGLD